MSVWSGILDEILKKGNKDTLQKWAITWIKGSGHAEAFSHFVGKQVTSKVFARLTGTGDGYSGRLARVKTVNEFDEMLQNDVDLQDLAITWLKETDNGEAFASAVAEQVKAEILGKLNEKLPQLFPSTGT